MKLSSIVIFFPLLFLSTSLWAEDYAIVIGVSEYQSDSDDNIISAEHDAQNIRHHLIRNGMPIDNIEFQVGGNANYRDIRGAFDRIAERIQPTDTVTVTWSTHGTTGGVWARDRFIEARELRRWVEKLPATDISIFIDSCKACSIDVGKINGKNVILLGAVGKNEYAEEAIIEEPNIPGSIPPEVKGISSFLYTLGLTPESHGMPNARADTNRDGRVDLQEVQTFMNTYGPLKTNAGNIKQTACIKERMGQTMEDWLKNLRRGRLKVTLENARGHRQDQSGGHTNAEWGVTYNFTFNLVRALTEVPTPESLSIGYGVSPATMQFSISGQSIYIDDQSKTVDRTQGSGSETFNCPRPFYSPHCMALTLSQDFGVYLVHLFPPTHEIHYHSETNFFDPDAEDPPPSNYSMTYGFGFTFGGRLPPTQRRLEGKASWDLKEFLSYYKGQETALRGEAGRTQELLRQQGHVTAQQAGGSFKAFVDNLLPPVFPITPDNMLTQYLAGQTNVAISGTVRAEWYFE